MIVGLGIDVVSMERIAEATKNPKFLERILTERERQMPMTPERVAGRWAAKEAMSKALPSLRQWHDVEIFNDAEGRPYVELSSSISLEPGLSVTISISHERGYAAAVAIIERP